MASVSITREYPYVTVTKSVETLLSLIYLNKLYIADVLIDIIKDYLYISKAEVIMNYCKKSIIASFGRLSVEHNFYVDFYGRRRQAHIERTEAVEGLLFYHVLCVTCGEESGYHLEEAGCCTMEWDNKEEPLMLTMEGEPIEVELEDGLMTTIMMDTIRTTGMQETDMAAAQIVMMTGDIDCFVFVLYLTLKKRFFLAFENSLSPPP